MMRSGRMAFAAARLSDVLSEQPFTLRELNHIRGPLCVEMTYEMWKPISICSILSYVLDGLLFIWTYQFFDLLHCSGKAMNNSTGTANAFTAIFAEAFLSQYIHKIGMCCTGVKKKRKMILLGECELGAYEGSSACEYARKLHRIYDCVTDENVFSGRFL